VVTKFHKLCERKGIIAFILKGQFSRKMVKAIRRWIDERRRGEEENSNVI